MKILLAFLTCTFLLSGCNKSEMKNDAQRMRDNFEEVTDMNSTSNVNLKSLPSYCNSMIGRAKNPYPHL